MDDRLKQRVKEMISANVPEPEIADYIKTFDTEPINQAELDNVPEWGRENPNLYGVYGAGKELFEQVGAPVIEGLGLVGGGIAGTPGGIPGQITGASLGYAGAKKGTEIIRRRIESLGTDEALPTERTIPQEIAASGQDIKTGALMEMGGRVAVPVMSGIVKGVGKAGSQIVGKLTGTGSAAVEEAFKSGETTGLKNIFKSKTAFDRALRGKASAQEVVETAHSALNRIKDIRSNEYRTRLAEITKNQNIEIDGTPISQKLKDLLVQYNIKGKRMPDGKVVIDASRVAMGKKGINDIKEVIQKVGTWGKQEGDLTPTGLDILKRQLDDFYSDSSQARHFVSTMRKTVAETIENAVPEYGKMTKGYSEATILIKDIESNLMMRKQGMSGRIVSDQTLRRLISAMKDNFELRRTLVTELTAGGDKDVLGMVAGHAMRPIVPRGLAGTGPAMIGNVAVAKLVTPAFWPVVAASSPRVSAEFIRALGIASKEMPGGVEALTRAGAAKYLKD